MRRYLPRIGFERFECFPDGRLIDPRDEDAMKRAFMFRWAFVVGWGERIWWAMAAPQDAMQRFPDRTQEGKGHE